MYRRDFLKKAGSIIALSSFDLAWGAARTRYSLTDQGMNSLAQALRGKALFPKDPEYEQHRLAFNQSYDSIYPLVIVRCLDAEDVRLALRWAKDYGIPISPRCGGHSYTGQSICDGMVLHLGSLNRIAVDAVKQRADIEGGASLIDVVRKLWEHRVMIPLGSCPTVGIAGLTLGGGYGLSSRKFGLACDNLIEAEIILASGETIVCSPSSHPKLFWALKGGGGGTLGIVTRFSFQVYPVEDVAYYSIAWDWKDALPVLEAWQAWAPFVDEGLTSLCHLGKGGERPSITSQGQFLGSADQLKSLLQPFLASIKGVSKAAEIKTSSFWDAALMWAGCGPSVAACHPQHMGAGGKVGRASWAAKSDFFKRPLPREGLEHMILGMEARQKPHLSWGGLLLDAMGGAINKFGRQDTAFVHRDALFMGQYLAYWNPKDDEAIVQENRDWLKDYKTLLAAYSSGESYQNYADDELDRFDESYFAENLPQLLAVKKVYDPDNLFRSIRHRHV